MEFAAEDLAKKLGPILYPRLERDKVFVKISLDSTINRWWREADKISEVIDEGTDGRRWKQ